MLTTTVQAAGAPWMDTCFTTDTEGRKYRGKAFLLMPWRRNRYGESLVQRALVIGWRQDPRTFCPNCKGDGTCVVKVERSGSHPDAFGTNHWYEGTGKCEACGWKGPLSDSSH